MVTDRLPGVESSQANSVEDLFAKLRKLRSEGRISEALATLSLLRDQHQRGDTLRYRLEEAQLLRASERYEEAIRLLLQIEGSVPTNGHAYRIHVEILCKLRRFKEAERLIRDASPKVDEQNLQTDLVYKGAKLATIGSFDRFDVEFANPLIQEPAPSALIVMMVKEEADIINANLRHHYLLGARKFVIIDNNSLDDTRCEIDRFKSEHPSAIVVTISDPITGYFQKEKTEAAVEFARVYFAGLGQTVSWVFVLDADEFLCASEAGSSIRSLVEEADARGRQTMVFHLCDATNENNLDFVADACDVYDHFNIVAKRGPRIVLKNAAKANIGARLTTGNHVVSHNGLALDTILIGAEFGWAIVHLPYRSGDHTGRKLANGSKAIEARNDTASVGGHWLSQQRDLIAHHGGDARLAFIGRSEAIKREARSHQSSFII